ncbi:MAG: hypothetical protein QMC74_05795 [Myxococcota bacterium]|jgi:hypothetical protein
MNIDLGQSTSRRIAHSGRVLVSICAVLLFLAASVVQAQERAHQITWSHAFPSDVRNFVVLISPEEGNASLAREVDVGKPTGTDVGASSLYTALVGFSPNEFLAVAAVGHDEQMSLPSGWGAMPPTRPGQPNLIGQ